MSKNSNRPTSIEMLGEFVIVIASTIATIILADLYHINVSNGWNDYVTDILFFGALLCAILAAGYLLALIIDFVKAYKSDHPKRKPPIR